IGIWGLGTFLPKTVRTNDWWSPSIVEEWRTRQARRFTNLTDMTDLGPGAKLVLEATAKLADDPFEGARERRVVDEGMRSTDMGIHAAREAMERAGIKPTDVDFVLVQSMVPDYHNTPDGCRIHLELGIRPSCFTATVDASCSGFLTSLTVAQGLITAGIGKVGLLVQCAPMSRILRAEDPWSAAFGDAATAVVVGQVREGRGILAQAHQTDGRFHGGLVTGVPNGRWHDKGAAYMYVESNERARGMVMAIPDAVKNMVESSLVEAKIEKKDVAFLAAHQATLWFGELIQNYVGLPNAKRVNTFPWTTSLSGCNLPMVMAIAVREGMLKEDDVTVMFSGATGMTAGALVCRWGR
ncbi:MAG TPA: 3-oxoacyl-[acyl-carrier-protein] synthase III C-terminal domain-containing protein, partial [Kofleriaceae bacterium]|nr:3-oxoacyl-[acyl-carrier-protein] synthase III C-terminal domain-containing protein [Kofleriaceae bacterium]